MGRGTALTRGWLPGLQDTILVSPDSDALLLVLSQEDCQELFGNYPEQRQIIKANILAPFEVRPPLVPFEACARTVEGRS